MTKTIKHFKEDFGNGKPRYFSAPKSVWSHFSDETKKNLTEIDGIPRTMPTAKPVSAKETTDFTIIEGIGKKISDVLNNRNITKFHTLANTDPNYLRDILKESGGKFSLAQPETWLAQAKLAAEGNIKELNKLKKVLKNGK